MRLGAKRNTFSFASGWGEGDLLLLLFGVFTAPLLAGDGTSLSDCAACAAFCLLVFALIFVDSLVN